MQHDHLIWETIRKGCAFKRTFSDRLFCRNEYNVTGLCNRASCPLANSRYATVREEQARCYLYVKTVERAHSPKRLWTKIKLSKNYQKALKQIDDALEYWPEITIHKSKQRLTKIFQYLLRIRKLSELPRPKIVPIQRNVEKVDRKREARAETVARIENAIEDELLKRLQTGTYGEIYNFPMHEYNKATISGHAFAKAIKCVSQTLEREVKKAREVDVEADEFEEAYESEEEAEKDIEYLSDVDFEQSDEDMEDLEQILKPRRAPSPSNGGGGSPKERPPDKKSRREHQRKPVGKRKKPRIELEMEEEFLSASNVQTGEG